MFEDHGPPKHSHCRKGGTIDISKYSEFKKKISHCLPEVNCILVIRSPPSDEDLVFVK
jgi:hypothetical protein